MILKVFSIYDQKSSTFNTPWFNRTQGEAERNFQSLVQDDKSRIHQYPEDFDLYYIGEYDDQKGVIQPLDTPQHCIKAIHFKQQ